MTLLDNEKVKEFFGCDLSHQGQCNDDSEIAKNVLTAMQEPIRKGLRVLVNDQMGDHCVWREDTVGDEAAMIYQATQEYHPGMLILPSRFQKKECECICHNTKENHNCCPDMNHSKTKPAPEPLQDIAAESEAGRPEKCASPSWHDEGCDCNSRNKPICASGNADCACFEKPSAAVEAKIMELAEIYAKFLYNTKSAVVDQLRALCALARGER